jgi:hypothetical protein
MEAGGGEYWHRDSPIQFFSEIDDQSKFNLPERGSWGRYFREHQFRKKIEWADWLPQIPLSPPSSTPTFLLLPFKMPKNMNTNRAASAVFQNEKALDDAETHGGALFGAVVKTLGNRSFQINLGSVTKTLVQATPRKLFQGGRKAPIRIAVGHVVLLAGTLTGNNMQRPLEIVGLLDSKERIRGLIKKKAMGPEILAIAESAVEQETTEDKVGDAVTFEAAPAAAAAAAEEDFWAEGLKDVKGGLREQRKAAETAATIKARVDTLKGQKVKKAKGMDGGIVFGDASDPSLFSDPDYETFKRWRAYKSSQASAPSAGGGCAAAQTEAELMAIFKLEKEAAEAAAEQRAVAAAEDGAAHAAALRAQLSAKTVPENWDEINLDDL